MAKLASRYFKDEKMKTISKMFIILIAFCVFGTAYMNKPSKPVHIIRVYVPDPNYIPTIEQIQQALKNTGNERYDPGPIDNKVGPKLKNGWENYCIDVIAKEVLSKCAN